MLLKRIIFPPTEHLSVHTMLNRYFYVPDLVFPTARPVFAKLFDGSL